MVKNIRIQSQQLAEPLFDNPKDLVSWMGAVQGQDLVMSKWAIGMRLKSASLSKVDEALRNGEILRTHILRPTWHLVVPEDIRWMIALSTKRLKSSCKGADKHFEIDDKLCVKVNKLLEKSLAGNNHLTKEEISNEIERAGIKTDLLRTNHFIMRAEVDGFLCSGAEKEGKHAYALLDERVPAVKELQKDEALAMLALKYFRSHSPAGLQDFVWWSGLTISEARHAIGLISSQLITDRFADHPDLFIHESFNQHKDSGVLFHLLPPYDEYLISYKDSRTQVLAQEHYPKAFTNYGIFYPVVMYNGSVVGNWTRITKSRKEIDVSFFEQIEIDNTLIKEAKARYLNFLS